MITIQENNTFISFEYYSNQDDLTVEGVNFNVIEIEDMSENLNEFVNIKNGELIISWDNSNYIFPLMFRTENYEHTVSVIGQLQFILIKLIHEVSI